jgi:hypothetical protein
MNWKGCGKKVLSQHLPGVTEENHKTSSQDSQSPGQGLNPLPPKYEAGVLTTRPQRLVKALGFV